MFKTIPIMYLIFQCTVNNDLSVDLILPEIFDFVKPFKVYSHDFAENMSKVSEFLCI